jgi:hypothetical protein
MEKNHGEKQYQLIAKKAANWLKKQAKSSEYPVEFNKYFV